MRNNGRRLLRSIETVAEQFGGLLLLVATVLVTMQIVLRLFGIGVSGLYDIATFCALWSVFLTAGVGIQRNIHVRVDVIVMMCSPGVAFLLNTISSIAVVIMTAILCYSGYVLVDESLLFGDSTLGMISVPMWIPQLIMPVGGGLMLLHGLAHLANILKTGPRPQVFEPETSSEDNLLSI